MRDLLPEEARLMRHIEAQARRAAQLYGYKEIITPVVESYELLSAKAGDEVRSRMFVFKDLGGRDVALRPEFTASVARLVATTFRNMSRPFRLFCIGSIYRYDEPQRGRYREIWQSNYELMGSSRPEADAEILMLTSTLMRKAGLKKFVFKIGHVGVLRGMFNQEKMQDKVQSAVMQLMDKKQYDEALKLVEEALVSDRCMKTLCELIDLKGNNVADIVNKIETQVNEYEKAVEAARNLGEILELVQKSGCEIDVTVDAGFARGLEYYTGMIFEIYVPDLEIALCGGGRYDRLIELFGGEPTPAVGVAHGIDRMMLTLQTQKESTKSAEERRVMVIPIKEELISDALRISHMLRDADVPVEVEVMGRKMVKALEDADRRKIDFAVIVGQKELKENAVVIRDLEKREQTIVEIKKIVKTIKEKTTSKCSLGSKQKPPNII
jgi:histidyl-tRNA synthetase